MSAVVLPGRAYAATMPLLALATTVLERHGHDVRAVSWSLPDGVPDDADAWVEARLVEALDGEVPHVPDVVVAKSLGTRSAPYVARRGSPAVWFTPLLRDAACAAGIRANPAPQLVVAGLADGLHDTEVAAGLGDAVTVLEVEGADHGLSRGDGVPDDDVLADVERALDAFVGALPCTRGRAS
ncbi:alpha/beta hydrolase [Nocardioides dongxiaopingii]|uniref:alpha/beta hydrolase n=1 Tax=Nocardioides dongxiaopingii TaxID=2576036 RepID=UPI0010C7642A|nr:alpha/beta hydrolase [Nocardioides dongxiaopingii]